ncbi:peroxisomal biogenesis factor 11 [Lichtheimia hyalospora FSU 10163]|nr:peroxisomal biogenesis factor 11 [Lichtheimia hyalospora FSU 10163]
MDAQVSAINRFLGTTTGREKLCRLVQYFARFYAFYLWRQGAPKDVIQRWADLKQHIGNGRKFFRLLKPIEFVQTAIHINGSVKDDIQRVTTIVKHLTNALYYSSEVFVLTTAVGFYRPKAIDKITSFGQRCWFISLFSSILADLYKLRQLNGRALELERGLKSSEEKKDPELLSQEKVLTKEVKAAYFQLLQDMVDIVIPAGNLRWLPVDEGVIGIAGMITAWMAMVTQWSKVNP